MTSYGIAGEAAKYKGKVRIFKGKLAVVVMNRYLTEPIPNLQYEIRNSRGTAFSGRTDSEGSICHRDVPLDDYRLILNDTEYKIPLLLPDDLPVQVRTFETPPEEPDEHTCPDFGQEDETEASDGGPR